MINNKRLKGIRVIVTAGSTWVPIDDVRVITNVFGGSLGIDLVKKLVHEGAEVLFMLGPSKNFGKLEGVKGLKVLRFKYYKDLFSLIKENVSKREYDVIIHSAAVSDYAPVSKFHGKIKSNLKFINIKLARTKKIVNYVKKWDPNIILFKFKLEVNVSNKTLLKIAEKSRVASRADFIVANDFKHMRNGHVSYILGPEGCLFYCDSKKKLVSKVADLLYEKTDNR